MHNMKTKYNANKSALFKWAEKESPPYICEYTFATALWYDFEIRTIAPLVFEYILENCMQNHAPRKNKHTLEAYFIQKENFALFSNIERDNCACNLYGLLRVGGAYARSLEENAYKIGTYLPAMITEVRSHDSVRQDFIPNTTWLRRLDRPGDSLKKEADRIFSTARGLETRSEEYAWMRTTEQPFVSRPLLQPMSVREFETRVDNKNQSPT